MNAIETIEQTQLKERPQMRPGDHRACARQGPRG